MWWYWGWKKKIKEKEKKIIDYIDVMKKEIEMIERKRGRSLNIGEINFGGGKKKIIKKDELVEIMEEIRERIGFEGELNEEVEIDKRRMKNEMEEEMEY